MCFERGNMRIHVSCVPPDVTGLKTGVPPDDGPQQ